ncbi:MAG TPA: FIST N-terminal domain-containing protein [Thermomicrobiales bacterium]|nr:FIST N-terminal domain-containing protein [Thermomicrobiales bacterium]
MQQEHTRDQFSTPAGIPRPPIEARASVVATSSWKLAVDLAAEELFGQDAPDGPPDLLILFVNDAWQEHYVELLHEVRQRSGAGTIVGSSASGVLAGRHEYEDVPGLSCLALWMPGVTVTPVRLHQESLSVLDEPDTWHMTTGVTVDRVKGIFLLADPYRMDSHDLLCGLRGCYPGVPLVGGMTSASEHRRQTWVFLDSHVYDEGGVALLFEGPISLVPVVSQGAEPVGEAWTVTKVERNTILEISNRPALDVLLDTADVVSGVRSRESFPFGDWLIGFAVDEYQDSFARGDFIVRGILGADRDRRGLVVGGMARVGQTVQFQMRDPSLATVDLRQTLLDTRASLKNASPGAAVLFTCNGRGEDMFGRPHHDTETVAALLPGVPLAGIFCNGEVGPAGPRDIPMLNGFTATVALLVPEVGDSEP